MSDDYEFSLYFQFVVVSFTIYTFTPSNGFSAQIIFVSLSLVGNLTGALAFLRSAIANIVQAMVSVKRLNTFLKDDELDPDAVYHQLSGKKLSQNGKDSLYLSF